MVGMLYTNIHTSMEIVFCHSVVFCITKYIQFDAGILCTNWSQYFKSLYLPTVVIVQLHSPLFSELFFGSTWRSLGSHELWWWKTVPWKLNLERLCCARLARTWCCDICSKQNGNICQKQTQHPGGTHSTRLHFETRLSADGPFYAPPPCNHPLSHLVVDTRLSSKSHGCVQAGG